MGSEQGSLEHPTQKEGLGHVLNSKNHHTDGNENPVAEEACENIVILDANYSTVDLVEELKEAERVEQDSHMKLLVFIAFGRASDAVGPQVRNIVDGSSPKHNDAHDHDVPDSHTINLAPNYASNDLSVFGGWSLLHNVCKRRGGSQGKSSHSIHDHVDPE